MSYITLLPAVALRLLLAIPWAPVDGWLPGHTDSPRRWFAVGLVGAEAAMCTVTVMEVIKMSLRQRTGQWERCRMTADVDGFAMHWQGDTETWRRWRRRPG